MPDVAKATNRHIRELLLDFCTWLGCSAGRDVQHSGAEASGRQALPTGLVPGGFIGLRLYRACGACVMSTAWVLPAYWCLRLLARVLKPQAQDSTAKAICTTLYYSSISIARTLQDMFRNPVLNVWAAVSDAEHAKAP